MTDHLERFEYDAVFALMMMAFGYDMDYTEVSASEVLTTHYRYIYLAIYADEHELNEFVADLDPELRYSLIPLTKMMVKMAD